VGSRDAARAEAYAREHGIDRAYGSYEALLADPDVEAVYVSLPNSLHVEWSIRALEAGKHVLAEKPLSRRPDEIDRAFDLADSAGLVLMEAFMYRHHPQTRKLEEVVSSGAIGELRQLRSSFSFMLRDQRDVRLQPELDGGALMDLGCYCVSMSRLLAGEPEQVVGLQHLGPTGVDLRFDGVLRFPGDVLATFHCGFDLPAAAGLEAIGSEGTAVVRNPISCADPHVEVNGTRIDVQDVDRYRLQLENLSEAIRGRAKPLLGREDALGQARTIEALYRSADLGAASRLD
jgi:predicted dehydrogenase